MIICLVTADRVVNNGLLSELGGHYACLTIIYNGVMTAYSCTHLYHFEGWGKDLPSSTLTSFLQVSFTFQTDSGAKNGALENK